MASTRPFPFLPGSAEVEASLEPWARMLVDAAGVAPGDRVLVVACGAGIVARVAADRTGDSGPSWASTSTHRWGCRSSRVRSMSCSARQT